AFGPYRNRPVVDAGTLQTEDDRTRETVRPAFTADPRTHPSTAPGKPAMPTNAPLNRKLRMGLVGGGQGAFIGRVHATAAILDNRAVLVAGALSSDPAKAKASAPDYDIKPERAHGSYKDMIAAELKLPASERIDFVTVA